FFAASRRDAGTFIDRLFRKILGRGPSTSERSYYIDAIDRGATREDIAYTIFASVESRRLRVAALYRRFLGRAPDTAGRDYWVDYIANGRDIDLALYLAASEEYLRRSAQRYPFGRPKASA